MTEERKQTEEMEATDHDEKEEKKESSFDALHYLKATLTWIWKHTSAVLTIVAIVGAFMLGLSNSGNECGHDHSGHHEDAASDEAGQRHTCAMHPQIQQDGPGICPICNMELVPVKEDGPPVGPREVALSETSRKLAEVATTEVVRKAVEVEIRMVGKVDYDETRVKTIAARLDGRIERLHADFTGKVVAAGDPLVDLYSPALFVAQKELLLALESQPMGDPEVGSIQSVVLTAAREKLRLWGLSEEQIEAIEARGKANETLTISAPIGGTIVSKQAQEGIYVKKGSPLLTVAALSVVWVQLDAYESDLVWLRTGQKVKLTTESSPGVELEGAIRFIEPFVSPRTRTAKVRVEVPNPGGHLKPEMFTRARVAVPIEEANGTFQAAASVVHTCTMHPEVRTGGPGKCPVCAMDLVPLAGHGDHGKAGTLPLVIPASAAMKTGKRAVAYVETERDNAKVYEGRTITLGPRAGDYFVVKTGVKEGELVVTNGNFKIDAALQILAKPSMMSMPSENIVEAVPPAFRTALASIYDAYFITWDALKDDNDVAAIKGFAAMVSALDKLDSSSLSSGQHQEWSKLAQILKDSSTKGQMSGDILTLRKHFEPLSNAALAIERTYGHVGDKPYYEMYCPMAFDNRGAAWLQESDQLLNPYFGESMLRCGETRETFAPGSGRTPELKPAGGGAHDHHDH